MESTNGEAALGLGEFLQREQLSQALLLTSSEAGKQMWESKIKNLNQSVRSKDCKCS